jgi:hypothetical protein
MSVWESGLDDIGGKAEYAVIVEGASAITYTGSVADLVERSREPAKRRERD